MDKTPQFERPMPVVLGAAPEERRDRIKQEILDKFGERHYAQFPEDGEKLKSVELQKQPIEIRFIQKTNEITNRLINKAGKTPFDIPAQNFHIIPESEYNKAVNPDTSAITVHRDQAIALKAEPHRSNRFMEATTLLHESIHLKGFYAIEATNERMTDYRTGLETSATLKKIEKGEKFFRAPLGLNEAVVEEMTKRHLHEIVGDDPDTKEEWQWTKSLEAEGVKNNIARKENMPPDEIYWIGRSENGYQIKTHPYFSQRKVLNFVVRAIAQDTGKPPDEIMELFFTAHFNGHLLEMGRLVTRSFGKGSFRKLEVMSTDSGSALQTLEYLEKQRQFVKPDTKK